MEDALSDIILLFYKFVDWLFYKADIRTGLSVGFILMGCSLISIIIATVGPRVISEKTTNIMTSRRATNDKHN